jgi:flavin reductase (DIM6/NTAB) family NADH-FMN oxidoreductase RutF
MYYEIGDGKEHRAAGFEHSPWYALVGPRPIGWISTLSKDGVPNLAPFSFFNAISARPPMVMYCANGAHAEGGAKDSQRNARDTGEFVHNMAVWDLRWQMNDSSATAPRAIDEFDVAKLTKAPSRLVKPARVAESPVSLECKVIQVVDLPSAGPEHSNAMVIGKVVAVHIRDDVVVDGRVDVTRLRPIARFGYADYTVVDSVFEMKRPSWPLKGGAR